MGIIRGTHTSPGIYTQITDIIINSKKQPTSRIGAIGYNTNKNKNNNSGGNTPSKPTVKNYLTFTALEDNSSIGLNKLSRNQSLWYSDSSDFATSHDFDTSANISLNNGDKVYVRGILNADNGSYDYTQFKMSGKIAASGNCNAIWNYEDLNAPLKPYCGISLFEGCTSLTQAPELPATTLVNNCYQYMFNNCTTLASAPELPATLLASNCYNGMFYNCTSLITASEFSATTLADYCCKQMFQYCTSLTSAPELPATTLSEGCYAYMFEGCTSLTSAPELPATTLSEGCYEFMFKGCTSLNRIKCLGTDMSANDCTYWWVNKVSNTGTFIKHPNATWSTGNSGIPEGWTPEDAVL